VAPGTLAIPPARFVWELFLGRLARPSIAQSVHIVVCRQCSLSSPHMLARFFWRSMLML
jgi:hypothetical protein